MNEFFTFITCKDFKVQPIAETNEFSVFVGVRPLFYHFVLLREVDGFCSYQQFHLHKFDLANEYLFHKNKAANNNEKKWLNSPFRWSL